VSSPPAAEPGWVAIALLGKTRGNRGELTALALSGKPERYAALREVYLLRPGAATAERFDVELTWFHQGVLVFKFRGVDSISEAELLVGSEVRVPIAERIPLEPGEFFQEDLLGCQVTDRRTGETLGQVEGWEDSGGAGLLEITGGLLIPFARSICVEIDPAARRIVVELPEGLKELNRP
jgi:16S rRNA processing protein RimM